MFKILSTKKFQFFRDEILRHPETGELYRKVLETCTVESSPVTPQLVPDWIKEDGLFELAVNDGSLTVIGGGK